MAMSEDEVPEGADEQPCVATASSFAGKIAFISGGTSGIGAATARMFARCGARVVIVGRNAERGREVSRACAAAGEEARFVQADVTRRDEIIRAVDVALQAFGRLDIAFNNAGFQEPRSLLGDQPDEMFDPVFDTNVRSIFYAMKSQIAAMLKQGVGVIINNASVSGVRNANTGLALYAASKAAVLSLTKSAAMEYAPNRIRINAVSPGRIVTPMMMASKIADMGAVAAGLPARRMGDPQEVARAVLWLASDASSFVFGHNLCVDGGFLAQ
jgi:NAD(P)-dependent dehydrogenase (short-subunit alcohol dehydrogenase family)